MSHFLKQSIKNGAKTGLDFNQFRLENSFKIFKNYLYDNFDIGEDVPENDLKKIFIFEMLEQGYMPSIIDLSDYINSDGFYPKAIFEDEELETIKKIEELDEDDFLIKRDSLVRELIKLGGLE